MANPPTHSTDSADPAALDDALDDALIGLPAPPRARTRVLAGLLVAISVASCALAWQLRDDVRYAFASSSSTDLGDGRTADPVSVGPNRVVTVRAAPSMAGAVRYTRPFYPGEHVVFPVVGRDGAPLYIQTEGRTAAPGVFTGRLVRFGGAGGRYARVGRYLAREFGAPVTDQSYLLVANTTPRTVWWAPLLAAFLLALAASDLALLVRLLRPLPARDGLSRATG